MTKRHCPQFVKKDYGKILFLAKETVGRDFNLLDGRFKRVKLRFTFISISYNVLIAIYYDSTDIVKRFYYHDKSTTCTYTY